MDRSIPHVRDIFSGNELCLYEHSPRNRRRRIESLSTDERTIRAYEDPKNDHKNINIPYSTKTLTDKDIRHLERHLSMKKTIRKQISRNLAQAFIEDPQKLQTPVSTPKNTDRIVTLTRAKMAKSEQPFLDMLKDHRDDTDSGNSSPTRNEDFSEDDEEAKRMQESSKFSFWKMFSGKKKR